MARVGALRVAGFLKAGGEEGIRTPGSLSASTVFKTAALNHSAIPPFIILPEFIGLLWLEQAMIDAAPWSLYKRLARIRSISRLPCDMLATCSDLVSGR